MRRLLPILLLCAALAAGCGGGGPSAADVYAQQQIGACAKVQKTLGSIPPPKVASATKAERARENKALVRYARAVDRALIAGMPTLRAVTAPPKLEALQRQWLAAVRLALGARLSLDRAPPARLQTASRAETRARRAANTLAGRLGIASGCELTY